MVRMARLLGLALLVAIPACGGSSSSSGGAAPLPPPVQPPREPDWPLYGAYWTVYIHKVDGLEPEDPRWMHLHHGHATAPEVHEVTVGVTLYGAGSWEVMDPASAPIELRYTVHGVPVSGWMAPPAYFTLDIDNPALDPLSDGFHDLSVDVRGDRWNFRPKRAFLHMTRGRPVSTVVPIFEGDRIGQDFGPGLVYVDSRARRMTGHPANPAVTPWTAPPYDADLYLELLAPNAAWGESAQMWWEDPPHPGVPFVRAMNPDFSQDHRGLRVGAGHERFPFRDGPRGVGWMSPYTSGQFDSQGGFAFAETGGPVRYLKPDGEIVTVAGWRVRPGRDPVWIVKPLDRIRANMEIRGQWLEGRGEFFTPLDVTIDPRDENVWYVAAYEDHCVWKIVITNRSTFDAQVSVLAGDPNHQPGWADGQGHDARFNGPASLVFDPVADVLYVADQDNDAIRRVTRDGAVTTLFGEPGMAGRLSGRGVADVFDQWANRAASQVEVTAAEAGLGVRPEIYVPQVIRVDSLGRIVLLELGFGGLRRIHPSTGETRLLGNVNQIFQLFYRGWAWFDVDRWGNSGPRDGIYWCKSVGASVDGEGGDRFNEIYAWLPPDGGQSRFIFGEDWDPFPEGEGASGAVNVPHYPWLIAVDPRGAVLTAGFGAHGVSRLRARRDDDPVASTYFPGGYYSGRWAWETGTPGDPFDPRPAVSSLSSALKFGHRCHNYLGFADAWGLRGDETDEEILDLFECSEEIRADDVFRARWLEFVRLNRGPR